MARPVCVVISTRDRGPAVVRTVRSILADDRAGLEIVVVDQSEGDATRAALRPFAGDGRIRYLRSDTRGLSAGRNAGIRATTSDLVVITDDDCEAPRGWLAELLAPLGADPGVGVVVSSVVAGPHDADAGCIPAFVLTEPFVIRSVYDPCLLRGLGPSLALRRTAWEAVGGFDEALGAGGRFRAGGQPDFYLRVVAAGYAIHCTPRTVLIHHGFRPWAQAADSLRDYCYGGGALWAKHVKRAPWPAAALLLRLAARWAVGQSPVAASISRRPSRALRLTAFARGFVAGALTRLDPVTGHFARGGQVGGARHGRNGP
jgi:GT2 family glycosyltransferase